MAEQFLLSKAWQRTELRGLKKIFSTVGLGILVLLWNLFMGLRGWELTKRFAICVPAAWLNLDDYRIPGPFGSRVGIDAMERANWANPNRDDP
jgi:hypothetical protein